jgi:hypothetical protein
MTKQDVIAFSAIVERVRARSAAVSDPENKRWLFLEAVLSCLPWPDFSISEELGNVVELVLNLHVDRLNTQDECDSEHIIAMFMLIGYALKTDSKLSGLSNMLAEVLREQVEEEEQLRTMVDAVASIATKLDTLTTAVENLTKK